MHGSNILVNCVYVIVQVHVDAYLGMQEHILQEKNCVFLRNAMQLGINEDVRVASGGTTFFCLFYRRISHLKQLFWIL